jgi:hypothetical protein
MVKVFLKNIWVKDEMNENLTGMPKTLIPSKGVLKKDEVFKSTRKWDGDHVGLHGKT